MNKYLIGLMVLGMSQWASAGFYCTSVDKTIQVITVENGNQTSVLVKDNFDYFMTGTVDQAVDGNFTTYTFNLAPFSAKLKLVSQKFISSCHGRACLLPGNYTITKGKLNFLNAETDLDCQ